MNRYEKNKRQFQLPEALTAAGWNLVWDDVGWVKAVHPEHGQTRKHFPARHRGLYFVIRDIEKLEAGE